MASLLGSLKKNKNKGDSGSTSPRGKKSSPLFGRVTEDSLTEKDFEAQFDNASTETTALLEEVALRKERVTALEDEIMQTKARMADLMNEISDLQGELQEEFTMYDQHRSMRQISRDEGLDSLLAAESIGKDKKKKRYEVNITEKELDALAHRFQKGIKVKDRKYHNTTFQNVFTGVEAVDWLVENWPKKLSRAQAVWLGNLLMRTNSFSHVTKSFPFMDKEYFYRFYSDEREASFNVMKALQPFVGQLALSLKDVRGLKKTKTALHITCDNQWYRINVKDWLEKPGVRLYFFVTRSNAELVVRKGKTRAGSIVIPIHTLSVDEDHKEWYQLNTPKGTGAFLQLGLRYTFLKGKDEGLIVPPLPFAPERFVKKDPTRSPSLSRMTQAKAKGHRAIHRCCDRENVFLVAKDHDEWTALQEHSEEKTGRAFIRGVFGYGNITAFDLSNEAVNLFIQQCPPYGAWTHLGATTTDKGGRMKHEINYAAVPIQKTSGQYPIRCVVGGDFSVAAGQVWVLEHGVGGVVYDIDGTLTPGDDQIVLEMTLASVKAPFDPAQRPGAASLCKAWAAKGYLPIYLSGRSGSTYYLTREWLANHGFPPGLILHTDKHAPTLPIYSSVGLFKRDLIMMLKKQVGMKFGGLYGNTMTDVRSYEETGQPKDRTFIVGKFGGKSGTYDVGDDFVEHVQYVVENIPDADVPAPRDFFEWN